MQKNYKLVAGLLVCVLGVGLKAAEQTTSAAVASLREAACDADTRDAKARSLELHRLEVAQNPSARLKAAQSRLILKAVGNLCKLESEVADLPPAQEELPDITDAARQAAEDMELRSTTPGGVVQVPDSILGRLIALGEQASIRIPFDELQRELGDMQFVEFERRGIPYMQWAYVGQNKVYFRSAEESLYCCSREWYEKWLPRNNEAFCDLVAFELFNPREVKIVLDVICPRNYRSNLSTEIAPITDCYIDENNEFGLEHVSHCFEVDQLRLKDLSPRISTLDALKESIARNYELNNRKFGLGCYSRIRYNWLKLFTVDDKVYRYNSDMGALLLVPGIKKGPQDLQDLPNGRSFVIVRDV